MLTQERLKQLLHYCPKTGVFTRLITRSHNAKAGDRAGAVMEPFGYRHIFIDKHYYYEHRLAWLYVYGEWPSDELDHIGFDGCDKFLNKSDNRIENLRDAGKQANRHNVRIPNKDSKTGVLGVSFDRSRGMYEAKIGLSAKTIHLGRYKTIELAKIAYDDGKKKFHFLPESF